MGSGKSKGGSITVFSRQWFILTDVLVLWPGIPLWPLLGALNQLEEMLVRHIQIGERDEQGMGNGWRCVPNTETLRGKRKGFI